MYHVGKKFRSNARATTATTKSNSNATTTTTSTAKAVGNGGRNLRESLKTKLMALENDFLLQRLPLVMKKKTEVLEEEEVEGGGTSYCVFDGTVLCFCFCLKAETHNKMLIR